MGQTLSLLWKEWREARAYLWIGLGVFLGLPVIGAIEYSIHTSRHFEIETGGWVITAGGVLAVFLAVGATCRDLSGRIEDFWRAVPVSVGRWLAAKYFVGVTTLLAACLIPVLVEAGVNRTTEPLVIGGLFSIFFVAVYSLAFAAGCLLRRTAHAATVGLAGMLLMWFLPVILPPLAWLNVMELDGTGFDTLRRRLGPLVFVGGMLILSTGGFLLARTAVQRSWHVESGRRMIYGSISVVFLLLCASASFELGTNLPILQQVQIPGEDHTWAIRVTGNSGEIETSHDNSYWDPRALGVVHRNVYSFHRFEISSSGIKLGSAFETDDQYWVGQARDASLPDHSSVRYSLATGDQDWDQSKPGPIKLFVHHNSQDGKFISNEAAPVQLWDVDSAQKDNKWNTFDYLWNDRLYVIADSSRSYDTEVAVTRLAILDISNPLVPKLLSNTPTDIRWERYFDPNIFISDNTVVPLPDLPGLPARERFKLILGSRSHVIDDNTLCVEGGGLIVEYRLQSLTDQRATLIKVGQYKPSMLQEIFGEYPYGALYLQNGLLYQVSGQRGDTVLPSINVFETRGPHPMQLVGHFAAPSVQIVQPLPDGRALVGGSKLWLVGPPRNRQ